MAKGSVSPNRLLFNLASSLILALATLLGTDCSAQAQQGRLRVIPLLFVPADNSEIYEGGQIAAARDRLRQYLGLAQSYYRAQLGTDTFEVSEGEPLLYASTHPHAYYDDRFSKLMPQVHHLMVRELFDRFGEDRYQSRSIYLAIYARPSAYPIDGNYHGGGRTFNGPPDLGGGAVFLELQWLMTNANFLSTLIHELGHSFGLTHVDCHGYDMDSNQSIMSYNKRLWSNGFQLSSPPPLFNPEEYAMLAQNKLAFPNFSFIPAKHNPLGKSLATADSCALAPMDQSIGEYRHVPGLGYELYWNGKVVNRPDSELWSRGASRDNCAWNKKTHADIRVECRYNDGLLTAN